ncbi:MAG: sulfite exporter TauE/SafE family protein [Phycisphaerae bacterium]|nr:sulfite exporter TauE/SafE family protein [Phycisphaerae bacterium]
MTFWEHFNDISAYLSGPWLVCVLLGLGLCVGVLTGLFGVGGAFLLNPILIVGLGVSESMVVGSSLSFTIGTGATGMARHMRNRNVDIYSMVIIGLGAIVGVLSGSYLFDWLKMTLDVNVFEMVVRALYMVLLLPTAWLIIREPKRHDSGKSLLQRLPIPPHVNLKHAGLPGVSLPGLLVIGLAIGVAKGLLGIGGGVLFMPLLLLVVGMTAHQAVGTSLGVVLFSSVVGTIKYGLDGHVNIWLVMSLLVSSSIGVQIGAAICERLHAKKLRRYFAIIVFMAVIMLAVDLYSKLMQ